MKYNKNCLLIFFVFTIILELIFLFVDIFSQNQLLNKFLESSLTRTLAGIWLLFLLKGKRELFTFKRPIGKTLLLCLPCFLIVLNNLPIIALINHDAYLVKPLFYLFLLAWNCFSVALFEELVFRGFVFSYLIEKKPKNPLGLFWAVVLQAAIFGLAHIFNLLTGVGSVEVFIQIGYSFLIGGMLAIVLVIARNIWLGIILHALYNFCGLLLPTLGEGTWWDPTTIIITIILALTVAIYLIFLLIKKSKAEYQKFLAREIHQKSTVL